MIGQSGIKYWVERNKDNFPHFIVIIGESGSGKRTVAKYIANKLSLIYSECEISTEAVRDVIDTAYKSTTNVLYCFPNADTMKVQAKNAMLKITEEPPENAYFCLTINDDSNLLDTLRSRAQILNIEPYSFVEIGQFIDSLPSSTTFDLPTLGVMAKHPGEAKLLHEYGKEFYEFAELVVDNIAEVEPANAFKTSQKLALKNEEDKYDLKTFLNTVAYILWKKIKENKVERKKYIQALLVTTDKVNKLDRIGVNKQQLYDMWVFEIRGAML